MKLNKTQIQILEHLIQRNYESVTDLSQNFESGVSNIDMALKRLVDLGLVSMERTGKKKQVSMSDNKHAEQYRKIKALFPHMRFEEILIGRNIDVIINLLRTSMDIKTLAVNLKVSNRTISRSIMILRNYGFLRIDNGKYSMNPQYKAIYDFIREFQSYVNILRSRKCESNVIIIWENLDEFIVESEEIIDKESYFQTGYGTLARYGIFLLTENRLHYFYSPYISELRLEDICLHILAMNPISSRTVLYVALAVLKNTSSWNWQYIMRESKIYHLNDIVGKIKQYINSKGTIREPILPSWQELKEKAYEYDIHV